MLRASSCGNMLLICAICAGSTARLRVLRALLLLEEVVLVDVGRGLFMYQRRAKKPTSATARSCGMLIEVSVWAMVAVRVGWWSRVVVWWRAPVWKGGSGCRVPLGEKCRASPAWALRDRGWAGFISSREPSRREVLSLDLSAVDGIICK